MREELARVDWKGEPSREDSGTAMAGVFRSYSGGTREIHPKEGETCSGENEASMADEGSQGKYESKRKSTQSGED